MTRYVLYHPTPKPDVDVASAVLACGAIMISQKPGRALVEASEASVDILKQSLADWSVSPEVRARIPVVRTKMANRHGIK